MDLPSYLPDKHKDGTDPLVMLEGNKRIEGDIYTQGEGVSADERCRYEWWYFLLCPFPLPS